MTAVANTAFTAAQFNTNVRDNLNETAPAKATTAGGVFVATGVNAIAQRIPSGATVAALQSTSSTSYGDLSTAGPAVTVTTGTKAIVHVTARMQNTLDNSSSFASFAVSGATTIAAADTSSIQLDGLTGSNSVRYGMSMMVTLTAGSNTFTMKYRAGSGTARFSDRDIVVYPL
jgi:hypothetical protein